MKTRWSRGEPDVSVVVPVVERHGDLAQLYKEFAAELARLGHTAEFIFVVDEHLRDAVPALRAIQPFPDQPIDIVLLGGPFGESAALTTGFHRARAERIVTLASYFQVEPAGLGPALLALDEGADLVVGRRHPRIDSSFNRLQTRLFHGIVRQLTRTGFHDLSCGFKVMKKRVARELSLYGGLHRFIPLLALHRGFAVREIPLPQRREDCATRYHGTPTYVGRLLDILNVFFLTKFTRTPLRFFGLLGAGLFSLGFVIDLVAVLEKVFFATGLSDRAVLLLGVLLMVLGVQTLSLGLVGEIIIFTHARNVRDYRIAEVIRNPSRPDLAPVPQAPGLDDSSVGGALQAS
ncbi:MAG TPA: glycosyltransferase [Thermoanaerobaculia bacterium]